VCAAAIAVAGGFIGHFPRMSEPCTFTKYYALARALTGGGRLRLARDSRSGYFAWVLAGSDIG